MEGGTEGAKRRPEDGAAALTAPFPFQPGQRKRSPGLGR